MIFYCGLLCEISAQEPDLCRRIGNRIEYFRKNYQISTKIFVFMEKCLTLPMNDIDKWAQAEITVHLLKQRESSVKISGV